MSRRCHHVREGEETCAVSDRRRVESVGSPQRDGDADNRLVGRAVEHVAAHGGGGRRRRGHGRRHGQGVGIGAGCAPSVSPHATCRRTAAIRIAGPRRTFWERILEGSYGPFVASAKLKYSTARCLRTISHAMFPRISVIIAVGG